MRSGGVVMLAGQGESTPMVYHALAKHFPIDAVIVENAVPLSRLLARRVRKIGPRRVMGQVLFGALACPYLRAEARRRMAEIKAWGYLDESPIEEAKLVRIPSVNSDEAIEALARLGPCVVVVNGTRVISRRTLAASPATFINMHAGITPGYRGVHGAYWALSEDNRQSCGVTVHLVDAGIDTGSILARALIEPGARDNFLTYPLLQLAAGLPALIGAVRDAVESRTQALDVAPMPSKLWSHPTLWQYLQCRWRRGVR
jgi:folate-dependent phosphoribosylglycinamide formyltransferase PurN